MASKDAFITRLNALHVGVPKTSSGGSTTLSSAAAVGASTLTVSAITNFASGDPIMIGSGEAAEGNFVSGAPSGSTITLARPLTKAHLSGETVVEYEIHDLGAIEGAGARLAVNGESVDVEVATQRLLYTTVPGYQTFGASWAWPTFTLHQLAVALGALPSTVTGSGTTASPYQLTTNGNELGGYQNFWICFSAVKADTNLIHFEMWGASMDYAAVRSQIARGQVATIPASARGTGGIAYTGSLAYTATTTYKASKAKVSQAVTNVGIYSAGSGVSTTLSSSAAAGATSLAVVSETGGAAGDRILIGTGDTQEIGIIGSTAAGSLTLRTALLFAHSSGEAVVEQTTTDFDGVTEEGVSFEVGGSSRPIRLATSALEAGVIPGTATPQMSFSVGSMTLGNIAYALGISQSDIQSSVRLPINTNVGRTSVANLYAKWTLADTTVMEMVGVNCTQLVNSVELAFNNRDVTKAPIVARPGSAWTFWQAL